MTERPSHNECPTCHSNTTGRVYKCKRKDCFWRTSGKKTAPSEKVHTLVYEKKVKG